MKTVFVRVQFVRKAPSSVQSVKVAPVRLAPVRTAPEKLTLANLALVRLQCEKSALANETLFRTVSVRSTQAKSGPSPLRPAWILDRGGVTCDIVNETAGSS